MKLKHILRWLLCLALCALALPALGEGGIQPISTEIVPGAAVVFPDPAMEAAVRESIGVPWGPIYPVVLRATTELDLRNRGITDITGIEAFTSLSTLYLSDNNITDITPLRAFAFLKTLDLTGNDVADTSFINTDIVVEHYYGPAAQAEASEPAAEPQPEATPAPTAEASGEGKLYVKIMEDSVWLRADPGLNEEKLYQPGKGVLLDYLATERDSSGLEWYWTSEGWVTSGHTEVVDASGECVPEYSPTGNVFLVEASNASIRSGPGASYEKLASLDQNGVARYLGEWDRETPEGRKWYKVSYNGKVGWVHSRAGSIRQQ